MARPLGVEFAGACYHVINRGNDRRNLFGGGGARHRTSASVQQTWSNINAGPSLVGAGFEERNHFSEPQAGWLLAAQQKDDNDDDDKEAD